MAEEKPKFYLFQLPIWRDSIRSISTFEIVTTYCLMMIGITAGSLWLLFGKETAIIGKEMLIFVVGSITGTAMGAVVAYHFKKEAQQNGVPK